MKQINIKSDLKLIPAKWKKAQAILREIEYYVKKFF